MDRETVHVVALAVILATVVGVAGFLIMKYASGSLQKVEVIQVDDRTRCIVVSRGVHISVDCISEKSE